MDEARRGASKARVVIDSEPFACAGRLLDGILRQQISVSSRVRVAIPGGSALEAVAVARELLGDLWRHVDLTWVDERCVPVADSESNRGAAAHLGLLGSQGPGERLIAPRYVLPLFEDGETPADAVRRVESAFEQKFDSSLDVAVLGMGPDGHVASLFPSRSMPTDGDGLVAHVDDSPKPPASRITLTRAALATAGVVLVVVAGEAKRRALERLIEADPSLPAAGLAGSIIVTDLAVNFEAGRDDFAGRTPGKGRAGRSIRDLKEN